MPDDVRVTIRLDQADIDALRGVDTKPTKRAPGHWRCVFWLKPPLKLAPAEGRPPPISIGDGEWITAKPHPSEEIADESGRADEQRCWANAFNPDEVRYVRAEYFPEYP